MARLAGLFVVFALVLGCGATPSSPKTTAEDLQKKAKETADAAAKLAQEKRVELQKEAQKQLDDADRQLKDWKEKVDKATGEAQVKLQKAYDDAKSKREDLAKQVSDFNKASAEGWEKLKEGLDKAGREIGAAFKKAADEFK